jgi:hypothetical protein
MKRTEFRIKDWKLIENIELQYTCGDDIQKEDLLDRVLEYLRKTYGFTNQINVDVHNYCCEHINMYDSLTEICKIIEFYKHYRAEIKVIYNGHIDLRIYHLEEDTQESIK